MPEKNFVVVLALLVTWTLCVKFQPSSTPPSDRFWWGVLVVVVLLLLLLLVTGVKQSQLLVLRLSLGFDNNFRVFQIVHIFQFRFHFWSILLQRHQYQRYVGHGDQ